MNRYFFYLIISLFLNFKSFAICNSPDDNLKPVNDGPYFFYSNDSVKVKWIKNSILREDYIVPENFIEIKEKFNLSFEYNDLKSIYLSNPDFSQIYKKVDSICILSDVHGEYKTYTNLLKGMGVIDDNLNWDFGKGHLVVLGDIFDRGDMVTEILWHLFGLEKQAEKAGGMVHVILGNHELMVLSKDLRFINEKYVQVEEITGKRYFDLYSENSVLGKWIRSKPVAITINNIIFVHGGFSIEMVRRNMTIREINQIFTDKIVGKDMNLIRKNEELLFLIDAKGPVWYRGYFSDQDFSKNRLDSILNFYGKKYIIVGHTATDDIKPLFNNRIIGMDAGIGFDQPGETLFYKMGIFYKGYSSGRKIKL